MTTEMIDRYKAKRAHQSGEKKASTVSPATINAELRVLRAVARKARAWKYLRELPEFVWVREPQKLVRFMTEEHFNSIYAACETARRPAGLPYPAPEWWRGLLVFLWFTGWRISEVLALLRTDVHLDSGYAITRQADNKGNRDESVKLHPIVVEHLTFLKGFSPGMFSWLHGERMIYPEFHLIQAAAGIRLDCPDAERHECNSDCRHYGFHDIRRTFATDTGAQLGAKELQAMMRHKSAQTTARYNKRSTPHARHRRERPEGASGAGQAAWIVRYLRRRKCETETRVSLVCPELRKRSLYLDRNSLPANNLGMWRNWQTR